ncbi:unnamed protein product, partial [Heterosigma akashiwo]
GPSPSRPRTPGGPPRRPVGARPSPPGGRRPAGSCWERMQCECSFCKQVLATGLVMTVELPQGLDSLIM